MQLSDFKYRLHAQVIRQLEEQLKQLQLQLSELLDATEQEEKSSAGDKYETQIEVLAAERQRAQSQKERLAANLMAMRGLDMSYQPSVSRGALVKLQPLGWVYIAEAIGEVHLEGHKVQLISIQAPLCAQMEGCQAGHRFNFRGTDFLIEEVG
jgi:DNA repair exonuclease SbcCD ATPase subunit